MEEIANSKLNHNPFFMYVCVVGGDDVCIQPSQMMNKAEFCIPHHPSSKTQQYLYSFKTSTAGNQI